MWSWLIVNWWKLLLVLFAVLSVLGTVVWNVPRLRANLKEYDHIRHMPKSYWGVQSVNFLDNFYGFAFGGFSMLVMIESFGLSKQNAGMLLAVLGIIGFFTTFASGPFVDRFGLRKTLLASLGLVIVFRIGMAICAIAPNVPHRIWIYIVLSALAGFPASVKSNAYHIGNRRFSSRAARSVAFSLSYVIMNAAALTAPPVMDVMKHKYHMSYSWVFAIGVLMSLIATFTTYFLVTSDKQVKEDDEQPETVSAADGKKGWSYYRAVMAETSFKRMITIVAMTLGVSSIFKYWSILSPNYYKAVLGEDAAIGTMSTINPLLIIILLFVFMPFLKEEDGKGNGVSTFSVVLWGTLISSVSMIPLCTPWHWWNSDVQTAYLWMNIGSMVVFSFGEILFSPRLSQYILTMAPKGQEGIYSAFATVPHFIANTMVNFMAGFMLAHWAPDTVPVSGHEVPLTEALARHVLPYTHTPEMMWSILTFFAFLGPLSLYLSRRWFRKAV